jgi:glycosyltransferase involved in cell wall biosynthesis
MILKDKDSDVTVIITSYKRLDLLKLTTDSFNKMNTYPVKEIIIIDDSGDPQEHEQLRREYPDYKLILNEKNIGLVESLDKVYAEVTTPYVFHTEDDFDFIKPGFIDKAIKVLKSNSWIMQVWAENRHGQPLDAEIIETDGVKYKLVSINGMDMIWHGFTFIASLRSMQGYEMTKPWTQWSPKTDGLSLRECKIGWAYHRLGYRGAALLDLPYCEHTGNYRTTW